MTDSYFSEERFLNQREEAMTKDDEHTPTPTGRTPAAAPLQNIPLGTESARLIRALLIPVLFSPVRPDVDYAAIERCLAAMLRR